jgi:hypothetical protein
MTLSTANNCMAYTLINQLKFIKEPEKKSSLNSSPSI